LKLSIELSEIEAHPLEQWSQKWGIDITEVSTGLLGIGVLVTIAAEQGLLPPTFIEDLSNSLKTERP
jgi:hypothetical protein